MTSPNTKKSSDALTIYGDTHGRFEVCYVIPSLSQAIEAAIRQ
jgi:hypothetical protein